MYNMVMEVKVVLHLLPKNGKSGVLFRNKIITSYIICTWHLQIGNYYLYRLYQTINTIFYPKLIGIKKVIVV